MSNQDKVKDLVDMINSDEGNDEGSNDEGNNNDEEEYYDPYDRSDECGRYIEEIMGDSEGCAEIDNIKDDFHNWMS